MKRRTLVLISVLWTGLAGLCAWAGWNLGSGSDPQSDNSSETALRRAPRRQQSAAEIRGEYRSIAESAWAPAAHSLAETEAIIRAALSQGSLHSAEALAALHDLSAEDAEAILLSVLAAHRPQPLVLIAAALGAVAKGDPLHAISLAEKHLSDAARFSALESIMASWAARDPQAALTWHREAYAAAPRSQRHRQELVFNSLIRAWAQRDPKGAFDACLSEPDHGTFDAFASLGELAGDAGRREEVMGLFTSIADETQRNRALPSAMRAWGAEDPAGAAAWLDAQTFPTDQLANYLISEWTNIEYEAPAEWLVRRSAPEKREQAITSALAGWAYQDPAEAAAWFERTGVTQPGISIIASSFARSDPERAVAWTMRVTDEAQRRETLGSVMGSILRSDPKADLSRWTTATGVPLETLNELASRALEQEGRRF